VAKPFKNSRRLENYFRGRRKRIRTHPLEGGASLLFDFIGPLDYVAGMGSVGIRRYGKLIGAILGLLAASCGGDAIVSAPAPGTAACDNARTWVQCTDGQWHNGVQVLPQCPVGAASGGNCTDGTEACFQEQGGLCQELQCNALHLPGSSDATFQAILLRCSDPS
jgi:hypothetical protein